MIYARHIELAKSLSIEIVEGYKIIHFVKGRNIIRISNAHFFYAGEIVRGFDYYFNSVHSYEIEGFNLVDFSHPAFHELNGFDEHPIFFNSFPEPVETMSTYLNLIKLNEADVVLDLGAYSGLSSIIFNKIVGPKGAVYAIEADENNFKALCKNINTYKVNSNIIPFFGCVHSEDGFVNFSHEGNVGSGIVDVIGTERGDTTTKVKSYKLSTLLEKLSINRVNFIKCDIEGAESLIFTDQNFFNVHKPNILVETHLIGGASTAQKVIDDLVKFGYSFQIHSQPGNDFPMLYFHM